MPNPAEDALTASGLPYRLISHGPVRSLAEAAQPAAYPRPTW